jgi:hypothetical protein
MKRIFFLLLICASSSALFAQRTANISYSGGVVNYVGDLGNEKNIPYSSANLGSAITIRDFLNNPKRSGTRYSVFDLQMRFSWHRLQYDETEAMGGKEGLDLRNYRRGIGFRNDLFGVETDFTYNFFPNLFAPLSRPKFSFFFLAGVGVFYGQPKADLFNGNQSLDSRYHYWNDGSIHTVPENSGQGEGQVIQKDGVYETSLRDWRTEGQGTNNPEIKSSKIYSNINVGFPFGGGVRYYFSKLLTFSAEFNYYYFLTDYLDDVSNRYATYEELRASFPDEASFEMAKYISDPTGQGTYGFQKTASRRGNPDVNDSFTFLSLEASYKITWKKRGIYGQ